MLARTTGRCATLWESHCSSDPWTLYSHQLATSKGSSCGSAKLASSSCTCRRQYVASAAARDGMPGAASRNSNTSIYAAAWPVTQPRRLKGAVLRAHTPSTGNGPPQQIASQACADTSSVPTTRLLHQKLQPQQQDSLQNLAEQPRFDSSALYGKEYSHGNRPRQQRHFQQQAGGDQQQSSQQTQSPDAQTTQQQRGPPSLQQQRRSRPGQQQQRATQPGPQQAQPKQQHLKEQQSFLPSALSDDEPWHQQRYEDRKQQWSNARPQQQQQQQQQQPQRGNAAGQPWNVTQQQQTWTSPHQQRQPVQPQQNWTSSQPQQQQRQPVQQQQSWMSSQPPQQLQRQPVQLFQGPAASQSQQGGADIHPAAIAPMLTQRITRSTHWRQLQELLAEHGASMNAIHVSAMMHRLSRLMGSKGVAGVPSAGQREQLAAMLEQLMERSLDLLKDHGKHELSSNAGALARLGYYRQDYVAAVTEAAGRLLRTCGNAELANLAWALARLGHVPDEAWLEVFQEETLSRMSTFNCVELGNTLWAHAKWGVQPPEPWLSATFAALLARMVELQPPQLSSVLWALAMLKQRPPPELLDNLLLESQVKLASFNSHGYATIAWSICRMDLRPRRQWLEDYVRHTHRAISAFETDQCFTNVSWALANWEHKPPEPWLRDFCRAVVPFMQRMPSLGLSILSTSLADLRHNPPTEWTSFLLEEFHRKRLGVPATQVAAVLWAASRLLRSRQQDGDEYAGPGADWVQQYAPLLQDLVDNMAPHLGSVPVPDLVDVAVGIADLGFFPGSAWMDAHESAVNARLEELSAYQFGLLKAAYTRLDALFETAEGAEEEEGEDVELELSDDAMAPAGGRG